MIDVPTYSGPRSSATPLPIIVTTNGICVFSIRARKAVASCVGDGAAERAAAERCLERLDELLAETVRSINSLADGDQADGGASRGEAAAGDVVLDAGFRAELARSVREAIGLGDVEAVERAVERLPEGSRQRSEIRRLVDAFDFEGVEEFLVELERAG